jgi:maleylacetoacetate isomerase
MQLYTFWRSSAAYRVRIALNLKQLRTEHIPVSLPANAQRSADYLARNPSGLVPALDIGPAVLSQSLAIIEYLDETHPQPPLLPRDPIARAQVRAMAQIVACDIHPLNNLRVLKYLKTPLGQGQDAIDEWVRHWIGLGFAALEAQATRYTADGRCLFGDAITLADICLVPQAYNARRFNCELAPYPTLNRIIESLQARPEFQAAAPERQCDAAG